MKKHTIIASILLGAIALLPVAYVHAQLPPGIPITLREITNFFRLMANFLLGISLVIAVIAIVWSGISYMAAGDDSAKVQAARDKLASALVGALIVLGVGVILQTLAAVVSRSFFA